VSVRTARRRNQAISSYCNTSYDDLRVADPIPDATPDLQRETAESEYLRGSGRIAWSVCGGQLVYIPTLCSATPSQFLHSIGEGVTDNSPTALGSAALRPHPGLIIYLHNNYYRLKGVCDRHGSPEPSIVLYAVSSAWSTPQ
jgi:hypothetical protein